MTRVKEAQNHLNWLLEQGKVKKCNICENVYPIRFFRPKGKYLAYCCKQCDTERSKKYKSTPKYREQHAAQMRRRNATPDGKKLLQARNQRAYLKRKKLNINRLVDKINQSLHTTL